MGTAEGVPDYHAWNEVYVDGEWLIIDTTVDAKLKQADKPFSMVREKAYRVQESIRTQGTAPEPSIGAVPSGGRFRMTGLRDGFCIGENTVSLLPCRGSSLWEDRRTGLSGW